jgi:SET domain-containing protein
MTKAHSRHAPAPPKPATAKSYRVRRSPIHGTGVFATRRIPKGARIVEYVGERVSHAEADRRYEDKDVNDNHTFLFTVDDRIVIDAGVGGNEARWINHSCDPNCETVIENKRVYIEAAREIGPGEELAYDYMISREPGDPENIEEIFACRCGAANCRGTMLLPPEKKKRRKPTREAAAKRKARAPRKAGTTRAAAKGKGAPPRRKRKAA